MEKELATKYNEGKVPLSIVHKTFLKAYFSRAEDGLRDLIYGVIDLAHETTTSGYLEVLLHLRDTCLKKGFTTAYHVHGLARVLEFGAKKYARNNWKKGLKTSFLTDAALRHFEQLVIYGTVHDEESGLEHIHHALFSIYVLIEQGVPPKRLDDLDLEDTNNVTE